MAEVVVSDWQQYLQKAERNERLTEELASLPQRYPEWEMTTLFYSALHYVNAFLATQGQSANYHRERYDLLDSQTSLGKDYGTLFQRSMNARYDYDEFTATEADQLKAGPFRRVKEGILALLPSQ